MSNDASNPSILVVEDEELVALHLRELLTDLGLAPHVFTKGKPALEAIGSTSYSAAVLDLGLPDIDGTRVVAALLARDPDFRIVLTTGQATQELEKRFSGASRLRVLGKPFDAYMLEAELAILGIVPTPERPMNRMLERELADARMTA